MITQSQQKAINQKKKIFLLVHPDATFKTHQFKNDPNTISLIAEFKMKSVLGNDIIRFESWHITKRGKFIDNNVKLFR